MELKGTKTEKNLMEAFAGESMARNKYTYFASVAKKEGYEQLAAIFEETAGNEKEHAKLWFKELGGIGTTAENLKAAAAGENEEWTALYPEFAKIAREEGFPEVARTFEWIAKVEKEHEGRFARLHDHVVNGTVFQRGEKIYWRCMECGHIHEGPAAPKMCPVCQKPQGFFEPVAENF